MHISVRLFLFLFVCLFVCFEAKNDRFEHEYIKFIYRFVVRSCLQIVVRLKPQLGNSEPLCTALGFPSFLNHSLGRKGVTRFAHVLQAR